MSASSSSGAHGLHSPFAVFFGLVFAAVHHADVERLVGEREDPLAAPASRACRQSIPMLVSGNGLRRQKSRVKSSTASCTHGRAVGGHA